MTETKCYCDEFSKRVGDSNSDIYGGSVSFTCPTHGQVTFDNRNIPPSVIRSAIEEYAVSSMRQRESERDRNRKRKYVPNARPTQEAGLNGK